MTKSNNILASLYKGDKEGATAAFENAMKDKADEAIKVKKVAVAADIFNKG